MDSKEHAINKIPQLAILLGCDVEQNARSVTPHHMECLRKADPQKIIYVQLSPQISSLTMSNGAFPFMGIFEEAFIPERQTKMIEEKSLIYFKGIGDKSSEKERIAYYTALGDLLLNYETILLRKDLSASSDVYQYLLLYPLANAYENLALCDLDKPCHEMICNKLLALFRIRETSK